MPQDEDGQQAERARAEDRRDAGSGRHDGIIHRDDARGSQQPARARPADHPRDPVPARVRLRLRERGAGRRARRGRAVGRPGRARVRGDPGRQRPGLDRDRPRRRPPRTAPGVRPAALGDERGRGRVRALGFGGGAGARRPHRHPVDRRERVGAAHLARAGDDGRGRARDPRPGLRPLQRGRLPGGSRRRARRGRPRLDPRADPEPPDRPALAAGARGRGDRVRRPHTPALARDRRPRPDARRRRCAVRARR